MNPLVTVIIPTYNQEAFIYDAVRSAMEQTYSPLEILVVDDCSTDNTVAVLKSKIQDPRVNIISHKKNMGRVANYKYTLMNLVNGEWFVNLDGDDYFIDQDFISRSMRALGDKDDIVMIQSKIMHSNAVPTSNVITDSLNIERLTGKEYFLNYYSTVNFSHLASIYNRKHAISVDFYNENDISSDAISTLKLIAKGDVILIDEVVGIWRTHGQNTSIISHKDLFIKNMDQVLAIGAYHTRSGFISPTEAEQWEKKMFTQYYSPILIKSLLKFDFSILSLGFTKYKRYKWYNISFVWYIIGKFFNKIK